MRSPDLMIQIDRDLCIRCHECVRDCPAKILKPGADGIPAVVPELEKYCLKCQHCLAVCPKGAVTCCGTTPDQCALPGPLPDPESMLHLIRQRRSVRRFRPDPIPPEVMTRLKDPLAWSPTGCNDHRLLFHVVEDPEDMEFFRQETGRMLRLLIRSGIMRLVYPGYKRFLREIMNGEDVIFRSAPHMIVASTPRNAPCREADPWIALSYFDLFAQSFGLGTCWCGFGVYAFRWNRKLRRSLELPPGYRVGSVLLFGEPEVRYHRATCPEPFPIRSPGRS